MAPKTQSCLLGLFRGEFCRRCFCLLGALVLMLGPLVRPAAAIRLKDIATFKGVRPNQLIGNGLVVGLNGTDDGTNVDFNTQELANMLTQMGINPARDKIKVKNIAAVAVTAQLPPFARAGSKIDILVSSLGDAKSLQGGTLLLTPLKAWTARCTPWARVRFRWVVLPPAAMPAARSPRIIPPRDASPAAPPWNGRFP